MPMGISEDEADAMRAVQQRLRDGSIVMHERDRIEDDLDAKDLKGKVFDMRVEWRSDGESRHCGSVGCIGGYMGKMLKRDPMSYVLGSGDRLKHLFYPPLKMEWGDITPNQAVKAIDRFFNERIEDEDIWYDIGLQHVGQSSRDSYSETW